MRPTLMMIGMTALLGGALALGAAAPARADSTAFTLHVQIFDLHRLPAEHPFEDDRKPIEIEPHAWDRAERRAARQARDLARIEEAARREAERIEEERAERRAFRRAARAYWADPYRADPRFEDLRERYRRD